MTEKVPLAPSAPCSSAPNIVFGSQPVAVVIQRPTVAFNFTAKECILLQKHLPLIKEFVQNTIKKNLMCSLCRFWYSEFSSHDDCYGKLGDMPRYVVLKQQRIGPASEIWPKHQIYLEICDEILPHVCIHFGGADEDESRKNAQLFLDNWEDFAAYVAKNAALYVEKEELVNLYFNLCRMTHVDRKTLNELFEKYADFKSKK